MRIFDQFYFTGDLKHASRYLDFSVLVNLNKSNSSFIWFLNFLHQGPSNASSWDDYSKSIKVYFIQSLLNILLSQLASLFQYLFIHSSFMVFLKELGSWLSVSQLCLKNEHYSYQTWVLTYIFFLNNADFLDYL